MRYFFSIAAVRQAADKDQSGMSVSKNPTVVLIVAFLYYGCGLSGGSIAAREFPLETHSEWTYLVSDSTMGSTDTLSFIVEGTLYNQGGVREQELRTIFRGQTMVGRAIISGNELTVFVEQRRHPTFTLRFPLAVGLKWRQDNEGESTVEAIDTIAGHRTYRIQMDSNIPKDLSHSTAWIDPDVGLVRLVEVDVEPYSYVRTVRRWDLLAFSRHPE